MNDIPDEEIPPAGKKTGVNLGDLVKVESVIQLALALPAGCLVGWLFGSWLDRHFHQQWMAIAGIALGAVAGFVQMITLASKVMKDGK